MAYKHTIMSISQIHTSSVLQREVWMSCVCHTVCDQSSPLGSGRIKMKGMKKHQQAGADWKDGMNVREKKKGGFDGARKQEKHIQSQPVSQRAASPQTHRSLSLSLSHTGILWVFCLKEQYSVAKILLNWWAVIFSNANNPHLEIVRYFCLI